MNPRETAIKLVAQAVDPSVTKEEARSFAHKAILFIHEHKLLEGPEASSSTKAAAFWKQFPIERVVGGISTAGLAAAAIEVVQLRTENERLKARLRKYSKLRRPR